MGTIAAMSRLVQSLDFNVVAAQAIEPHTDKLAELNRKELMKGKGNDGKLLSPRHSQNPFFKTPQSALRYARWKQRITPETPFDVPNLFIVGQYHGSISFQVEANRLTADASSPLAGKIEKTFRNTALGLNPDAKVEAYEGYLRNDFVKAVANHLHVRTIANG